MGERWRRVAEWGVLFVALPVVLWWWRGVFGFAVVPLVVAGFAACVWLLLRDRGFERRRLWLGDARVRDAVIAAGVFCVLSAGVGLAVWVWMPERLFALVRARPGLWRMIMVLYPVFSVYPQEVIFRAFFFHRYASLFGSGWGMILASGLCFGWAHLMFNHWLSVGLSAAGGVLFAWTYARTRSTLLAAFEHALWGDFLFTIGLGAFFYGASSIAQG